MLEKCIYGLYACVIGVLGYYGIDAEGMIILTALMIFDVIFGVTKSYVLESGTNKDWFSTHKLKIGLISKVSIFCVFILFGVLLKYVTGSSVAMDITTMGVLGIFIVAEFISVLQNAIMIRTGKAIAERDALSYGLNMLYKKFSALFKVLVSSKED